MLSYPSVSIFVGLYKDNAAHPSLNVTAIELPSLAISVFLKSLSLFHDQSCQPVNKLSLYTLISVLGPGFTVGVGVGVFVGTDVGVLVGVGVKAITSS
jgi:hypothetical protein